MKCPSCGNENPAETKFCGFCGAKLSPESSAQQSNTAYQNFKPEYPQPHNEPFFKQTWFIILSLIVFFPVGLVLMWSFKKEWKTTVKIIVTAGIVLLFIIGLAVGGGENDSDSDTDSSSIVTTSVQTTVEETSTTVESTTVTTVEETTTTQTKKATESTTVELTEAPTEATTVPVPTEDPNVTIGMKNALKTAQSYLSFSAFSYTGLIEQLEYEKYSVEEATYAADNCGADWNEQAAKCAQSYIDFTSFSRDGLIDQLIYEGFTQEQAEYGAQAVGY